MWPGSFAGGDPESGRRSLLGFVAAVITGLSLRRDRGGLAGLLQVPDSLAMRMEAIRGGRYSSHLIEHHAIQEGDRLWDALDAAHDADTREALATSGAFEWCVLYHSLQEAVTPQRLRSQAMVIDALDRQGWSVKPYCSELDEALESRTWPTPTKVQVLAHRAAVAAGTNDVVGAIARFDESWELLPSGESADVPDETLDAHAVWTRCALQAASTLPFEALSDGTATALIERAADLMAGLVSADTDRFTIDALRLASLRTPLLARRHRTHSCLRRAPGGRTRADRVPAHCAACHTPEPRGGETRSRGVRCQGRPRRHRLRTLHRRRPVQPRGHGRP